MKVYVQNFGLVDNAVLRKLQDEGFRFHVRLLNKPFGPAGHWNTGFFAFEDDPEISEYKCNDDVCETALRETLKEKEQKKEYSFEEKVKAFHSKKLWWRFPDATIDVEYARRWTKVSDDIEMEDFIQQLISPDTPEIPEWFIGNFPPMEKNQSIEESIKEQIKNAMFFMNKDEDQVKKCLNRIEDLVNRLIEKKKED